jgi:putative hydrolase of the HAD superfamily
MVGALKPERKIFEHAIQVSGFRPDALFFTDDREENVLAARELGIHAHQFRTERILIAALEAVNVEIKDFIHS